MGYPTRAFIVLPDGQTLEAPPGGAAIGKLGQYRRRPLLHVALPLTEEQRQGVAGLAEQYVRTREPTTDARLCISFAERLGLQLLGDRTSRRELSPGDLYRLFEDLEWLQKAR